jgi:hypothetical protein
MARGVCSQILRIELAASHDHRIVVSEFVTHSDEPLFHDGIMPEDFADLTEGDPLCGRPS